MLRKSWHLIVLGILNIIYIQNSLLLAQEKSQVPRFDTIHISADSMILFKDSIVAPVADTIILVEEGTRYKIKKNRYKKSQSFYDSVYHKTHKKRISKELYNIALSYNPEDKSTESGKHTVAKNPFEEYEGKVIRNIRFVNVDILEGSVNDTLKRANSGFSKILNKGHIHTHDWILKKFLLVKPGDKIISAILADNERVFREIPAIEDVKILVVPDTLANEYADLIIVTKDVFSIGGTASASSFDVFSASVWDNNSFGLAYELGGRVMYDSYFKNPWGYEIYSKYRNLLSTFIDGTILWYDAFDSQWLTFNFSKDFLTPQTKYGGGLSIGWVTDKYELGSDDTLINGIFETNYQDIWLGRSILLGNKSSRNNLYLSARYERKKFTDRPYTSADSNISFQNRNIYYAKIGYAHYNFYKASMIKSFGISEDIPYGINIGLTVAYLDSDFFKRVYLGGNFGAGKYLENFGYLAGNVIAGGFYKNGVLSQGLFESNLLYYTPLVKVSRYTSRTFLRFRYREAITRDIDASINFDELFRNLNQENIGGQSTMVFNFETVLFSPWYFYGFRFAPYVFADVGMISRSMYAFTNSQTYAAIGAGFRIRNESLAFKTIILSFGYIPNAPAGNIDYFYTFSMGEDPLISVLGVTSPYILSRSLILPY